MERYRYSGPVKEFDRIISDNWTAETSAVSEAKARTNLSYRYKKQTGRVPASKITLPGKLIKI